VVAAEINAGKTEELTDLTGALAALVAHQNRFVETEYRAMIPTNAVAK
jgi:hypothetical protein